MMTITMSEAIEEARLDSGAEKLSVSVVPGASPEAVRDELLRVNALSRKYSSFPKEARQAAEIARLRGGLRKISSLVRVGQSPSPELMRDRLREVFHVSDMFPDVDLDLDVAWMEANGFAPESQE